MKRILAAALLVLVALSAWAQGKVFTKPITIVCSFSAGGGTDLVNRALAESMKQVLGVQVNVVNMVGGSGAIAMEYVRSKPRDGQTIVGCSETNLFVPANGGSKATAKDWQFFWAGGSPGVIVVKEDSKYKTFAEFLADAKANPDKVKISTASLPGLWSVKTIVLGKALDAKINVIPFAGSAPAITACLTGEVDAVHASVGEVLQYLQAKKMRALIATELKDVETSGVEKIVSITKDYPATSKILPIPQILGIAIPADTPDKYKAELTRAFNEAMKMDVMKKILESQVATPLGLSGAEANSLAQSLESKFSWTLVDLGKAKKDPASMGIAKP